MATLEERAKTFLALPRIAVAGVARKGDTAANAIYRKLRKTDSTVVPINPHADSVEGDHCYPSLAAVPGGVDAVVIGTPPAATLALVQECVALNIRHVWIHQSIGRGSYNAEAVALAEAHGITVIPGGCPMMFSEPVDVPHKCLRWFLNWRGKLPAAQGN